MYTILYQSRNVLRLEMSICLDEEVFIYPVFSKKLHRLIIRWTHLYFHVITMLQCKKGVSCSLWATWFRYESTTYEGHEFADYRRRYGSACIRYMSRESIASQWIQVRTFACQCLYNSTYTNWYNRSFYVISHKMPSYTIKCIQFCITPAMFSG